MSAAECRTYAAWQQHYLRGETPCDDCIEAAREYRREYMRKVRATPAGREKARRTSAARGRALTLLARRHPEEYRALYAQVIEGGDDQ